MELNRRFCERETDFTILRSAEINLSPAGEADMASSALNNLDIVLGSFHSALRRKDDQTSRYIAALRNHPAIQILGHPESRIYNYREGLHADSSVYLSAESPVLKGERKAAAERKQPGEPKMFIKPARPEAIATQKNGR
jgi:histidinol phosphatase-like PHP family hydrolase